MGIGQVNGGGDNTGNYREERVSALKTVANRETHGNRKT